MKRQRIMKNEERLQRMVELTFLDSIAEAYTENFEDLSDFCFVFPNKRAGAFFLKSLGRVSKGTILAPEVLSISDFIETVSGRQTASRIDLLFRLFRIYRSMQGGDGSAKDDLLEFEKFRSWGEILLDDFSEVDQYLVDPDEIFKNVTDYKEISSNFLTEDQIEILEHYFNFTPNQKNVGRFWKHANPGGKMEIHSRFLELWRMLAPLYNKLARELAKEGLATSGGNYRHALAQLKEKGKELLPWQKVVIVGFNALSISEAMIFEQLQKMNGLKIGTDAFVDFFWDISGPVLNAESSDAGLFLRLNRRNFPSPDWTLPYLRKSDAERMPNLVEVLAAPSNAAQVKIAGEKIAEVKDLVGTQNIEDARVAVVLPDENLLLPLLYSLPDGLGTVNLTMGYSLRFTSTATFIHHLRKLVVRARKGNGKGADLQFFREDLSMLLSHPFGHLLFGSDAVAKLNTKLQRAHNLKVSLKKIIEENGEAFGILDFTQFADKSGEPDTRGAIDFINSILLKIDESLSESDSTITKQKIDRSHIVSYRQALATLALAAEEHGVNLGLPGVFYMTDRLLAGEKANFEGQPLAGLQVMGLLETRALDFEHLIILSMNDKSMPRKSRRSTFIPEALRSGYGLPSANYQEKIFSYYFYRMISRAKTVSLIYDARSGEGMRSGGESRYIMQLRYLHMHNRLKQTKYNFKLKTGAGKAQSVVKTDEIMNMLSRFTEEGSGVNFSASALKKYGDCQVKFFYEEVIKLKTDPLPSEFIDPITHGNIIHDTMFNLYFPDKELQKVYLKDRLRITSEYIDRLLEGKERIRRTVDKMINKNHFHRSADTPIEGTAKLIAAQIGEQICEILEYDRTLTPFELVGGEISGLYRYEYAEGKSVNMKYAIDRLDVMDPDSGHEQWRIVDYKTGSDHVTAKTIDDIFNGSLVAKNIFQLMLYANLMNLDLKTDRDVKLAIYQIETLSKSGEFVPKVTEVSSKPLKGHKEINDGFLERLNGMLKDIFDRDIPFTPTDNESSCTYCTLKQLCGKEGE